MAVPADGSKYVEFLGGPIDGIRIKTTTVATWYLSQMTGDRYEQTSKRTSDGVEQWQWVPPHRNEGASA